MESAPLTAAHSHARNATLELSKANPTAASNEHELAAGEFSKAAVGTDDTEALRILALLEEYHHALAKSIQTEPRPATHTKAHYDPSTGLTLTTAGSSPSGEARNTSQPSAQAKSSPSRASGRQRPRDLSSSIASNLASARGIPGGQRPRGAPISPTVTAHTAMASASSQSRQKNRDLSPSSAVEAARKQLWQGEESIIPRPIVSRSSQAEKFAGDEPRSPSTQSDTAFNRFYSNFEGYFSTLTAPLVFAGFPLNPSSNSPATSPQPVHSPKPPVSSAPNQNEPDLTNIFSRSALRALKDKNGLNTAAESFYVVPTSGGTVSYAQMVNHSKHPHEPRTTASAEGDEFVDASETPYPTSPIKSKHSARTSPSSSRHTPVAGGKVRRGKTLEELELETHQQRDIIDNLSKRLVQFETHSQSQRLALAQSMHSHRSPSRTREDQDAPSDIPPVPPLPKLEAHPPPGSPEQQKQATDPKMEELQASLLALQRENAKLARENERRGSVITQYREKWEELKMAARRKAKQREATAAGTAESTNDQSPRMT